jgi:hypothetical protein
LIVLRPTSQSRLCKAIPLEQFAQLFGNLLVFVYHCFDRIVINGYRNGLSRPEQVVHFVRQVLGIPVVSKEVLSQRTNDYQGWAEAFARNHKIPIEWAEKGVRKEDSVLPALRRMVKKNASGVYFIFKSMEQGRTFRISVPKYPTQDPNHRILAHQTSRFTHYYFYIRDEVLGPIVIRVASFFPFHATYYINGHSFMEQELKRNNVSFRKNDNAFLARRPLEDGRRLSTGTTSTRRRPSHRAVDDVAALQAAADRLGPQIIRKQLDYWTLIVGPKFSKKERRQMSLSRFYSIAPIEYCRNFIFKRHFPIHKIFERRCELGLWRLTANRSSEIFGVRLNKRLPGKLATVIDQIEHTPSAPGSRSSQIVSPLPGAMPPCACGLSAAAENRPAHHHRHRPLSRHQNPRHADRSAARSPATQRQYRGWLDCQTGSRGGPDRIPTFPENNTD